MDGTVRYFFVMLLAVALSLAGSASVPARPAALAASRHPSAVISLGLADQVRRDLGRPHPAGTTPASVRIVVTARQDPSAAIRTLGGRVLGDARGRVVSGVLPASRLADLAAVPGVSTVFPSEQATPEDDISVPEIGADRVWTMSDHNNVPIQGKHVVVGIVDSGIDLRNPAFRNADGTTRIKYLWDQTASGGPAPQPFGYGLECTDATIDAGTCPERDTDGHGTHVAGIAAGEDRSTTPITDMGVAPEADIMVVKSPEDSADVIAAWQYLIARAQSLGEPIVINNSFGVAEGPHDGTEPMAQAIDALSGPGRIFVKSAGNDTGSGGHAAGTVQTGQATTVPVVLPDTSSINDDSLYCLYPAADEISVQVTDTGTHQHTRVIPQNGLSNVVLKRDQSFVTIDSGSYDQQYREAYIEILSPKGVHHYTVTLRGTHVSGRGRFDIWIPEHEDAGFQRSDPSDTLTVPGDARQAITVGNYITRVSWTALDGHEYELGSGNDVGQLDPESSFGPTASGIEKPDLAAPGSAIFSALSGDVAICSSSSTSDCTPRSQITPDGHHLVDFGTSMAAPHVTGTIALMLQVDPSLDPATADAILRATARHDAATGAAAWTPGFGAGKLNALAAVQSLLTSPPPAAAPVPTATLTPAAALWLRGVYIETKQGSGSKAQYFPTGHVKRGQQAALVAFFDLGQLPAGGSATWDFRLASASHVLYHKAFTRHYTPADVAYAYNEHRNIVIPRTAPPGTYRFMVTLRVGGSTQTLQRLVAVK